MKKNSLFEIFKENFWKKLAYEEIKKKIYIHGKCTSRCAVEHILRRIKKITLYFCVQVEDIVEHKVIIHLS